MKRSNTISKELIAPCGMNCGICFAYLRETNKCPGCRGDDSGKPIKRLRCKIKTCKYNQLSGARYCFKCEKFPCDALKHLDKRYRTKYSMSMIRNLEDIKKIGIREFVRKERVRWACHECGGTICVHKKECCDCKSSWKGENADK